MQPAGADIDISLVSHLWYLTPRVCVSVYFTVSTLLGHADSIATSKFSLKRYIGTETVKISLEILSTKIEHYVYRWKIRRIKYIVEMT